MHVSHSSMVLLSEIEVSLRCVIIFILVLNILGGQWKFGVRKVMDDEMITLVQAHTMARGWKLEDTALAP